MLKLTKEERHKRMIAIHSSGKPLIDHVDEILELNEAMVVAQARHHQKFDWNGNDISDFIQIGLITIHKCCEEFDRSKVSDPNDVEQVHAVWKTYMYRQIKFHQQNMNRKKAHEVRTGKAVSLEVATASEDDDTKLHDILEDEGADSFTQLSCIDYPIVRNLFHVLNEKERVAISHLTGIDGHDILMKVEIAEIIGVTKADVKNQFDRGIRKLKAAIKQQAPLAAL